MNTPEGRARRVGVEIEFGALSAGLAAEHVRDRFGGHIEREDPHRFHVRGARLGDFTCELDTSFAHRGKHETMSLDVPEDAFGQVIRVFQESLRELYGDVSSLVMPCEVVCPPIEIGMLSELEALVDALLGAGAAGTHSNPLYGFGFQLNPDIAEGGQHWIVAMLKSYLLLSDWLRAVMRIDPTRRLFAYTDPFPASYTAQVVDPAYWPDQRTLIDDYLIANPTRNREFDLLPLFAWLDHGRLRAVVRDERIKARPTFHYRLPDSNFGEPGWGVLKEWRRWCVVERLAERPDLIDDMGRAWRANRRRLVPQNWAVEASEWIMTT